MLADAWNHKFDAPRPGLKTCRHISYEIKNGKMCKETITRTYFLNGEYNDSQCVEVICDATD